MSDAQNATQESSSWQNVAYSNMIGNEALLRLLVRKGLISKDEFSEEVKKVHEAFVQNQQSSDSET